MLKIIPNSDKKTYDLITSQIKENDGYCACRLVRDQNTKCICSDFKNQTTEGFCYCGRFQKVEVSK